MDRTYLIIWIIGIPSAILGNWGLIEDWASMGTTEPFDPINYFRWRKLQSQKVVLYRYFHSIMNFASLFNQPLIALHITIKSFNPSITVDRCTMLNKTLSVSTLILRSGQILLNAVHEILRNEDDIFTKWSNGSLEA